MVAVEIHMQGRFLPLSSACWVNVDGTGCQIVLDKPHRLANSVATFKRAVGQVSQRQKCGGRIDGQLRRT